MLENLRKPLTTKQKFGIGFVVGGVVVIYFGEKKRVAEIVANLEVLSRAAVLETMQNSWEEGFKYGLKMAKEVGVAAAEQAEYAFKAFDKAS